MVDEPSRERRPLHVELHPILDLTEVRFIHGNHDTDSESYYDNLWHSELAHRNQHARVTTVAGYKVAGQGGVFRESIWDPGSDDAGGSVPIRRQAAPTHEAGRTLAGRQQSAPPVQCLPRPVPASGEQHADILVTQEGLGGSMHGRTALGVTLVVHGHLHKDIDYQSEGRISADSPFSAFGVNQGSHLRWPLLRSTNSASGVNERR